MTHKTRKAVPISDGSYAVVVAPECQIPQTVGSFVSEAQAEEWIAHQPATCPEVDGKVPTTPDTQVDEFAPAQLDFPIR